VVDNQGLKILRGVCKLVSGLLDNKTRVLDTIVTIEGRKQLSQGGIDIAYVSFSDGATHYAADVVSGSQDATQRIYLEAGQLPQDQITFQADDSGNVVPFANSGGINTGFGKIVDYTYTGVTSSIIGGGAVSVETAQGNNFINQVETLLASSIDNFNKLRVIATHDPFFEDDSFLLGPNSISFTLNDSDGSTLGKPIRDPNKYATHVSALDSIFSDPRFGHLPNFKYLPPINKVKDESALGDFGIIDTSKVKFMGQFMPWGLYNWFSNVVLDHGQVAFELKFFEQLGYMKQINFDPTSTNNNLVGQFFEKSFGTLKKLDVVDYGRHRTGDHNHPTAHIFFVGKVTVDEKGTDTFIHLFTLVFK
jgi:hypothetical protein